MTRHTDTTNSRWIQIGLNAISREQKPVVVWLGKNGDPRGSPDMPQFVAYGAIQFETIEEAIECARHTPHYGYGWTADKPFTYVTKRVNKTVSTTIAEENARIPKQQTVQFMCLETGEWDQIGIVEDSWWKGSGEYYYTIDVNGVKVERSGSQLRLAVR